MAVTAGGTPYVESSDLVANYPAVSLALAEHIGDLPQTVLQVVSATYSVQTTTTSTGVVSTGLTATITPSSTTSKVLAMASGAGAVYTNNARGYWQIYRGTTGGVGVGSAAWILNSTGSIRSALSCIALDSPSTTSAQIYTFIFSSTDGGSLTTQFNNVNSTMILMEVSA